MWSFKLTSRPELKPTLYSLSLPDGRLLLAFTPQETIVLPKPSAFQRELFLLLDGFRTVAEIAQSLQQEDSDWGTGKILEELERLNDLLLLEDAAIPVDVRISENERMRYDRQLLFFAAREKNGTAFSMEIQEKIRRARVVLMGLGGYGSHIFYGLASLGVGSLTLVDCDRVDISNLNRQILYGESDVGMRKVDVVKDKAPQFNSQINYDFMDHRVSSPDDIVDLMRGADLLVLAADSPREKIFDWTNQAAYQAGVPVLFSLGVTPSILRIGPLVVPGKTACFRCAMPAISLSVDDPVVRFINGRSRHGVIASHLMMAGGAAVLEILRHLTGFEPCRLYDRKLIVDVARYEMTMEPVRRRASCPFCGADARGR